jgi:hypothetical protein
MNQDDRAYFSMVALFEGIILLGYSAFLWLTFGLEFPSLLWFSFLVGLCVTAMSTIFFLRTLLIPFEFDYPSSLGTWVFLVEPEECEKNE